MFLEILDSILLLYFCLRAENMFIGFGPDQMLSVITFICVLIKWNKMLRINNKSFSLETNKKNLILKSLGQLKIMINFFFTFFDQIIICLQNSMIQSIFVCLTNVIFLLRNRLNLKIWRFSELNQIFYTFCNSIQA